MLLVGDLPLPEHPDTTLEPPSDVLSLATDAIRRWIRSLSARLQAVYHLLYVRGCTQREAATVIGVTQPSVAQLHRQLLQRGRRELLHLWA
jgi:DNA-directed RNA polymerase specialized sigma subunit